jgi:hypothetical protein
LLSDTSSDVTHNDLIHHIMSLWHRSVTFHQEYVTLYDMTMAKSHLRMLDVTLLCQFWHNHSPGCMWEHLLCTNATKKQCRTAGRPPMEANSRGDAIRVWDQVEDVDSQVMVWIRVCANTDKAKNIKDVRVILTVLCKTFTSLCQHQHTSWLLPEYVKNWHYSCRISTQHVRFHIAMSLLA